MNINNEWIALLVFGTILFLVMIVVMSFLVAVFFRWVDERSAELKELEEDDDRPEYNL